MGRIAFTLGDKLEFLRHKLLRFGLETGCETLAALQRKLDLLDHQGWCLDAADASFYLLVLKLLKRYRPWFEVERYSVLARGSGHEPYGIPTSSNRVPVEASVKLTIGGEIRHAVREGIGPVNALELAFREALLPTYPRLDDVELTNFAVQVANGEHGTAPPLRVTLQSWDRVHNRGWGSVAVSDDFVSASCLAIVDSFEFKCWSDADQPQVSCKRSPMPAACRA